MFEIYIIPIVIFIVLFVPPIILGFTRGWKASLFFAGVMLFATLMGLLFGLTMYDSAWDTFKNLYIKDLQPGISIESFKDVSKSSIVGIVIGLALIPGYILAWSIYFPLKHKFKKHLYPKTEDIDSNTKKIERSMNWPSRLSGVAISTVSALFVASTASTTSAILLIKDKDRFNGFNKFTSGVTKIYTFGQVDYSNRILGLLDFAQNDLDVVHQQALTNVFAALRNSDLQALDNEIKKINNEMFMSKLREQDIEQIIKIVFDATNPSSRRIKLFDNNYHSGAHAPATTRSFTPTWIDESKESAIKQLMSHVSLNLRLSESDATAAANKIIDRTTYTFEDTGFMKEIHEMELLSAEANGIIVDHKKAITTTERSLQNKEKDLSDANTKAAQLKNTLITLGYKVSSGETIIVPRLDGEDSIILSQRGTIMSAKDDADSKASILAAAGNAFITADGDYNAKRSVLENKDHDVRNKDDVLEITKRQLSENAGKISQLKQDISNTNDNINTETIKLGKIKASINANNKAIATADNNLNKANNDLASALTKVASAQSAVTTQESIYNSATDKDKPAELTNLNRLKTELANAKHVEDTARSNVQKFATEKQRLEDTKNTLSADKTKSESNIQSYNTKINNYNSELSTEKAKTSGLESSKNSATKEYNDAKSDRDSYKRNTYNPAKILRDQKEREQQAAQAASNQANRNWSNLKYEYDKAIQNLADIKANKANYASELIQLSKQISTLKGLSYVAPAHERYVSGTSQGTQAYMTKPSLAYMKKVKATLPEASAYKKGLDNELDQLRKVSDSKRVEFNKVKQDYVKLIKSILMS